MSNVSRILSLEQYSTRVCSWICTFNLCYLLILRISFLPSNTRIHPRTCILLAKVRDQFCTFHPCLHRNTTVQLKYLYLACWTISYISTFPAWILYKIFFFQKAKLRKPPLMTKVSLFWKSNRAESLPLTSPLNGKRKYA